MKAWHVILILLVGYFLGIYFGSIGQNAVAKVQGLF